jgi:alpha-tubulin suppressor-like RCC1 family protein
VGGTTTSISVGFASTCAVNGGDVYCWGDTSYLFHDPTDSTNPPVYATPHLLATVKAAAGGAIGSIVTRGRNACAIGATTDNLVCWGDDSSGEVGNPPPGTGSQYAVPAIVDVGAPVAEVRLTEAAACARLESTGHNVLCWGSNESGILTPATSATSTAQPLPLPTITDATMLRAGRSIACAQSSAGLYCWGRNVPAGQIVSLPNAVDVAVGGITSPAVVGIDASGNVSWSGQSETAPFAWSPSAPLVDSSGTPIGPMSAIAFSVKVCGVSLDKTSIRCAGLDGTGPTEPFYDTSVAPHHVVEISLGSTQAGTTGFVGCVRLDDAASTIECWGDNTLGELGIGGFGDQIGAKLAAHVDNAVSISAGATSTSVLASDGTLTSWGASQSLFGQGNIVSIPTKLDMAMSFSSSAAKAHVRSYEEDDVTYLVDGITQTVIHNSVPNTDTRLLATGLAFADAAPGFGLDVGFVAGESSVRFFENASFNAGPITDSATMDSFSPLLALPQPPIELGYSSWEYYIGNWICARVAGGEIVCWGDNTYGQLGVGDASKTAADTPTSIIASGATGLCVGHRHGCAATASGPSCWGDNTNGQASPVDPVGVGESILSPKAVAGAASLTAGVACGEFLSCAWGAANVGCWGENDYGQSGDPSAPIGPSVATVSSVAGLPPTGTILGVAAGDRHVCALESNGDVYCWGSNDSAQCAAPPINTMANPTAVVFP